MDQGQWLMLAGGFVLGGLLAAGGVYAWLAAHAKRDVQRRLQLEQAYHLAGQQLTQARKQIEQLQRENHELRLAVRPAPRPAPPPEPVVDAAEATRRYAEAKMQPPAPKEVPKAFKDTVVLKRTE